MEELQNLISKFDEDDLLKIVNVYSNLHDKKLSKVVIAPSSEKIGDSYLSQIVRFSVNVSGINQQRRKLESVSVNVIAKVLPQNLARRKTFRSTDFFENEVIFYDKVWCSIKKFYKSKNLQDEFDEIIPLFFTYYLDGQNDYICLEDLSYKNFESVQRGNGLDYSYTIKVMDLFAKFHSLSLAFKDQKPAEFTEIGSSLKETYFSKKYFNWYENVQHCFFELVRDAVKKELPEYYYDKIDFVFKNDFYQKVCDICENNHCHLSGITEGDAWIPNFLFRKDDKGDLHVALIDFQLARWAPFSNDIVFFMLCCIEESILMERWDEIIGEYVTRMKNYLIILGSSSELINIEQLQEDIKQNIYFTIAMSIEALTMSLIDGFNIDLIKGDEAVPLETVWVIRPFEDKIRRQRVANMIKLIVDKGLI